MKRFLPWNTSMVASLLLMLGLLAIIVIDSNDLDQALKYIGFDEDEIFDSAEDGLEEYLDEDFDEDDLIEDVHLNLIYLSASVLEEQQMASWIKNNGRERSLGVVYSQTNKLKYLDDITEGSANAQVRVKKSTYDDRQKSFQIRLYDKAGLWHDQRVINLDKNRSDPLRIREKLSYDYLKFIPDTVGLNTQFARLFMQGSSRNESDAYIDLGFYTHVEHPNKSFLKRHGLDDKGSLYEVMDFNFDTSLEIQTSIEDAYVSYFEKDAVENLENPSDDKLNDFIKAVHDPDTSPEIWFGIYLDEDNYFNYLAYNILFDNYEASTENYMLFSPLNSQRWFLISNDFDKTWGNNKNRPKWKSGLGMFWDNALHRKILMDDANLEVLEARVDELSEIINADNTEEILEEYYDLLLTNVTSMPDLAYLDITVKDFVESFNMLPNYTQVAQEKFYNSLEHPMPFELYPLAYKDGHYVLSWEPAFDLHEEEVEYKVVIAQDPLLNNIVQEVVTEKTEMHLELFNYQRKYYWTVTAINENGYDQTPMNAYVDDFGDWYDGIEVISFD